jgi:rRNA maturation endonuclease Nob1
MKYICKNCKYRFESKEEKKGKMCPYCGEKTVDFEPSAEDLLNDIE